MTRISVAVDITAPVGAVWREAADLASHAEWMADAESIVFESDQTSGTGTVMLVATRIGPFRTLDRMVVTAWEEQRCIAVEHRGLVRGKGRFTLHPHGDRTRFSWDEDLTFPWFLGGPLTAWAARPVLRWIWRRNLDGLRRRVEGRPSGPGT